MFFSAFTRGSITSWEQPSHLNLKSIPERSTENLLQPHGWDFFMISLSPTRTSIRLLLSKQKWIRRTNRTPYPFRSTKSTSGDGFRAPIFISVYRKAWCRRSPWASALQESQLRQVWQFGCGCRRYGDLCRLESLFGHRSDESACPRGQ